MVGSPGVGRCRPLLAEFHRPLFPARGRQRSHPACLDDALWKLRAILLCWEKLYLDGPALYAAGVPPLPNGTEAQSKGGRGLTPGGEVALRDPIFAALTVGPLHLHQILLARGDAVLQTSVRAFCAFSSTKGSLQPGPSQG